MKKNVIKDKSFDFALRIVKLYQYLVQLLRSGTSVGANVRESEHAQSKADFIHKLSISLKEANETDYWLELLYKSDYLEQKEYYSLKNDSEEILKLLVSIIKSSKANK